MSTATRSLQDVKSGAPAKLGEFNKFMEKLKPQMALALPKHLHADRMTRLMLTAFSTSSQLQQCDFQSIAAAIMTAGQLGLEPGVNGAGYLIPYGKTCTFVPGWKGLVDLVNRSGNGTVYTGVIFRDQEYAFTDGARRDLVVHNETDLDAPEDITHAYAIGWVKGAEMPIIELWRVSKIEKHRDKYNKVGRKHYSFRDWEMYARKVPLLQVLKYMPTSVEVRNAIAVSNAAERGEGVKFDGGIVLDGDYVSEAPADSAGGAIDMETGEVQQPAQQQPAAPGYDYPAMLSRILKCTQPDVLDLIGDDLRDLPEGVERQKLEAAYAERRQQIDGDH